MSRSNQVENGWPMVNLVDQLDQIIDNRGKTPVKSEAGIPALSAKSVKMGEIDYSKVYYVSEDTYSKFMVRGLPKVGDVLLTTEAPLGCVARLDRDDVCLAQRLITLRGKKGVLDNDYLRFYLSSSIGQHALISRASGSTVQGIKRSEFCKVDIVLPPYEKQLEIVSKVRSIEEKIALNRQLNQTLENIAQAIFKSWFVDFDPTRAKIAAIENGEDPNLAAMATISGKSIDEIESLSDEQFEKLKSTAELFPDSLVESELRGIPKGWEVGSFSKVAKLDTTSVKPNKESEMLWEHFSIPAYDVDESPRIEFGEDIKSNKYKVDTNAILSSKLNPSTPRTWWPDIEKENSAICSTEFMQFVPHNPEYRAFTLGMILSKPFQEGILQRVTGSTGSRQRAQPPQVANMEVVLPSEVLIKFYSNKIESLYVNKAKKIKENLSLAKIRETLLPKLLSGELEVASAN